MSTYKQIKSVSKSFITAIFGPGERKGAEKTVMGEENLSPVPESLIADK